MESLADLVARHPLAVLFGAVGIALLGVAIFWRLVVACAPACWRLAAHAWSWLGRTGLVRRATHWPLLRPLLTGTLTVARFLGVFAIAAFVFAMCALAIFFELAEAIGADESLGRFDIVLSAALHEHVSQEVLRFFAMITWLGEPQFLFVLAAFVAGVLLTQRRWMLAGAWIAATTGGALMNRLLKAVFERDRPLHDHGLVSEASWSFPSGHASGSVLIYGLLGYLIVRHTPRAWHLPVALVGIALIVFVGTSRVVLQVHYLSDVLAGYASAAAWVAIWVAGLESARLRQPPR
jgi:undecaprenyl-diphosphatase